MNDFEVRTQIQDSKINGLYQEVNEIKNKRSQLKDTQDQKTEKIISHVLKHGNVIAYKNNEPYVLTVKNQKSRKFDKAQLSHDMNMTQSELDLVGIAELVEDGKITAEKLGSYWYEEPKQVLRARKAKPKDLEIILGSRS
ncbi:hypothetical protein [Halobacillus karajensis]|uniref:hypothetical protein n=1 Tax=Halobacillus karajensis TaxID=195088 RepID=UPI00045CABE9|nr:hypothetical protein [Halobacillus karajensis]CDQ17971.1 hypothetical protein BN982_00211 [Halobacillus karajensis]